MKAELIIEFKRIGFTKVTPKLSKDEKLMEVTNSTVSELAKQIKKYFSDKKIKTAVYFKITK